MAMLAEPRRKQKISADPRNLNWQNDDSKFGQKMMEKMGWSKGKGLGATEQGDVDHITVKLKNDFKGVGCSKSYGDTWIAHQDDFNSLLANLNENHSGSGSNTPTEKVASLEQSSKNSKSRVHYGKFTRGKDLSRRDEEELKCIFGTKRSKVNSEVSKASSSSGDEEQPDSDQNLITSTQSVGDYFAQKMAALQRLRQSRDAAAEQTEQTTLGANSEEVDGGGREGEVVKAEVEVKKSKKSKKTRRDSEACDQLPVNDEDTEKTKKKSKKSKRKRVTEDVIGETTEVASSTDGIKLEKNGELKKGTKKSNKSKKKKLENVEAEEMEVSSTTAADCDAAENVDSTENSEELKKGGKKSKKSKKTKKNVETAEDLEVETEPANEVKQTGKKVKKPAQVIVDNSGQKSKKKKRKRKSEKDASHVGDDEQEKVKGKRRKVESIQDKPRSAKSKEESRIGQRYMIQKKTGKKLFLKDLASNFVGSNLYEIPSYGPRK